MPVDLGFLVGAGEGNRTLMTSLEGVPHGAVVGADLHVGVAVGSRGLPLFTLANGTLMARRPWWARAFTAPEAAVASWQTCAFDLVGRAQCLALPTKIVSCMLDLPGEVHRPWCWSIRVEPTSQAVHR
jgi:hypothetical protein